MSGDDPSSNKIDVAARRLDVTARSLDLLTAITNVTAASNPVIRIPWEVGQWLGREGLPQHELEHCMRMATGLLAANADGQVLFDNILTGIANQAIGPLFLRQSGSLGRLMARDPSLNWMISTAACLFQFHRDERFVAHALTSFIIRCDAARNPDESSAASTNAMIYSPAHVQLTPVVTKIVSSVWYNVINARCDKIPLPPELLDICPAGHYLDAEDFGLITHILTFQCKTRAILRTNHLLRDLMVWLLLHYDGLLAVTLGGRVIFERDFGKPGRELEVNIKTRCADGDKCVKEGKGEAYTILQDIAGKFEHFLSGYSFSSPETPPQPGIRQPLYEPLRRYNSSSIIYDKGIQLLIRGTAQTLVKWLLQVPVQPQQDFTDLGFSATPIQAGEDSKSQITVSHILSRIPSIVHLDWGVLPVPAVIFTEKSRMEPRTDSETFLDESMNTNVFSGKGMMATIRSYFPPLEDLVKKVMPHCKCMFCGKENRLKDGCLCLMALDETLILMAHGIADAFGATDASAVTDIRPIVKAISFLLYDLCVLKQISWDSWFRVAAIVVLGCPFKESPGEDSSGYGGTAFAAMQYGDLVTIAPWIDLSQEMSLEDCFGMLVRQGRVGVLGDSTTHDVRSHFQTTAGNFAIIETGGTEDTAAFNSRSPKDALGPGSSIIVETDASTAITTDVILVTVDETFYRLLVRIKSSKHRRVVDPADAMNSVIRRLLKPKCPHSWSSAPTLVPEPSKLYSFEDLLGRWPDTVSKAPLKAATDARPEHRGTLHISSILDTNLKHNIALALTLCTTAIDLHTGTCCFKCGLKAAAAADRSPLRESEGGPVADRYIITLNIQNASGKVSTSSRKLIC